MVSNRCARLVAIGTIMALALGLAFLPAVAAAAQAPITICHRTGSETNPWVFMTIRESQWPSYQERGAFRASSASECVSARQPAAVAQPPAAPVQPPAAAPQDLPASPPESADRASVTTVASTTAPEAVAAAPGHELDVSVLPATGEPVLPAMALVFVALGGLGLYLRRLGGKRL